MRPCIPTYLELSVLQLAAFGAPRPHNLKSVTFRLSCYSSSLQTISPRHFICERFATPPPGFRLLMRVRGFITNTTLSAYHRGALPLTDVGRVGGVRQ